MCTETDATAELKKSNKGVAVTWFIFAMIRM